MLKDFGSTLKQIINQGDILYIPSDITNILVMARRKYDINTSVKRNKFLNDMIDTLQSIVGDTGTIMFPIFSWDFNKGKQFNIKTTLGQVGNLPNWILLNRPDFLRTKHPIYSFMVWGKDARMLASMNNADCWGEYSPFGYMHRNNAKTLFLNVSIQRGFTFMHYVEESIQVPYRYFKNFKGEYIDYEKRLSIQNYTMYVRDLNINMKEYNPDSFYEEKGLLKSVMWNEVGIKILNCNDAYEAIKDDFLNNGGHKMYHYENYEIDWNGGHTHEDEIDN